MLPGSRIRNMLKYKLYYQPNLDMALSRMSWILVKNSCTSEIESTPASESCTEEMESTCATLLWEMSCSIFRMVWAAILLPVVNSERLWSAFLLAGFKVMLSGTVEGQNPNAARWTEKYQINLDAYILVARHRWKKYLVWHHNLWDLMLAACFGLEVTDTVANQAQKQWRDWRSNDIRLIKGCVYFWCLNGIKEDGIQALLKVCNCLS